MAFQKPAANAPAGESQGFSSVSAVFDAMPGAFVADAAADVNVVFQYVIAGAGEWHCAVENASCTVVAGVHDSPTCILKMADTDFLKMMTGQLPPMQAYTSGKLKIEGDIMKSQLIEKLFRFKRSNDVTSTIQWFRIRPKVKATEAKMVRRPIGSPQPCSTKAQRRYSA